ncbi:hypothetical protein Ancab_022169, partial [Ancistrocladus abbreviatus]
YTQKSLPAHATISFRRTIIELQAPSLPSNKDTWPPLADSFYFLISKPPLSKCSSQGTYSSSDDHCLPDTCIPPYSALRSPPLQKIDKIRQDPFVLTSRQVSCFRVE